VGEVVGALVGEAVGALVGEAVGALVGGDVAFLDRDLDSLLALDCLIALVEFVFLLPLVFLSRCRDASDGERVTAPKIRRAEVRNFITKTLDYSSYVDIRSFVLCLDWI